MLSQQTARFLLGLLDQQQLQVGHPDFDVTVANVLRARQELQTITSTEQPAEPPSAD